MKAVVLTELGELRLEDHTNPVAVPGHPRGKARGFGRSLTESSRE